MECRASWKRYAFDAQIWIAALFLGFIGWALHVYVGDRTSALLSIVLLTVGVFVLPIGLHRFIVDFFLFVRVRGDHIEFRLPSMNFGWAMVPLKGRHPLSDIRSVTKRSTNYRPTRFRDSWYSPNDILFYVLDRLVLRRLGDYFIIDIRFANGDVPRMAMMTNQDEFLDFLGRRFPDLIKDLRLAHGKGGEIPE